VRLGCLPGVWSRLPWTPPALDGPWVHRGPPFSPAEELGELLAQQRVLLLEGRVALRQLGEARRGLLELDVALFAGVARVDAAQLPPPHLGEEGFLRGRELDGRLVLPVLLPRPTHDVLRDELEDLLLRRRVLGPGCRRRGWRRRRAPPRSRRYCYRYRQRQALADREACPELPCFRPARPRGR